VLFVSWSPRAGRGRLQTKRFLLLLEAVALGLCGGPVLGLHLGTLLTQTLVDLVLDVVAAAHGLVHESLGVTLLESGDDFFAC